MYPSPFISIQNCNNLKMIFFPFSFLYLTCTCNWTSILFYVGHLESKERLRIQPAQLFNFSWWVMWCVQQSVDSCLVQFVLQTFPRCECDRLRQWKRWYQLPPTVKVRGVIRFLQAENVRPCEIHQRLVAVYGENVMNADSVRKWCTVFTNGRTDVHDAERSGRPYE